MRLIMRGALLGVMGFRGFYGALMELIGGSCFRMGQQRTPEPHGQKETTSEHMFRVGRTTEQISEVLSLLAFNAADDSKRKRERERDAVASSFRFFSLAVPARTWPPFRAPPLTGCRWATDSVSFRWPPVYADTDTERGRIVAKETEHPVLPLAHSP